MRADAIPDMHFLDLNHNGSNELVSEDGRFFYIFASYAGSLAPTRILKLDGKNLTDVTRSQEYRSFLLQQLHGMEESERQVENAGRGIHDPEINSYLAGWVAQKTLLGQTDDAWRTMLASYNHSSTDGLTECHVDERVWDETTYPGSTTPYRHCPQGQEYVIPFPEALAIFLVKNGYLTPDQSKNLGYDVDQIESDRKEKMAAATSMYEQSRPQEWYVTTNFGNCVRTVSPSSPAALISVDRASGLMDSVLVLKSSTGGRPLIVRVGEPQPGNMETVYMFFRGSAECEVYLKRQQRQIDDLK
jgi:hypothetical protein